jgi:hypothetical protein
MVNEENKEDDDAYTSSKKSKLEVDIEVKKKLLINLNFM